MITDIQSRDIVRSKDFEETQFKIAATAHVFELLRSKIYTNKPLAVLREIAANAKDAHVDAGKENVPIEISLPSILEPTLKVRDYGNSMDHETVMTLYSTYGLSTKNRSNKFIGAFGIGKLSSLGYSSSFQLTCIQNNYKRIYNIYLDEESIGKIALLFEGQTDEADGTEVTTPVNQKDIHTFIQTAQNLFRFWEPRPIIKNCKDFAFPENKWKKQGKDWGFLNESSYFAQSFIVMGGVPYRINHKSIPELSQIGEIILSKSVVLFANIGDITVDAGRENVEFSKKSLEWIKNKILDIENEAKREIEEKIKDIKTEFDARKVFYDFFATGGVNGGFFSDILHSANYSVMLGATPITTYSFPIANELKVLLFRIESSYKNVSGYKVSMHTYSKQIDILPYLKPDSKIHKFYYYISNPEIEEKSEIAFLRKKMRYLLCGHYCENMFIFWFKDEAHYLSYITSVGFPANTFKSVNDIVIPPKDKKPRAKSQKQIRLENADVYEDGQWRRRQVSISKETGYYTIRLYSNYYLEYAKANINNNNYVCKRGIDFLDDKGKLPAKIYAFTPAVAEKLNRSKWIPLSELIKEELVKHNEQIDNNKPLLTNVTECMLTKKVFRLIKNGEFKPEDDYILKEIYDKLNCDSDNFKIYEHLNNFYSLKLKDRSKEISILRSQIDAEIEKYTLLNQSNFYLYHNDEDNYILYLNAKYQQLYNKSAKKA